LDRVDSFAPWENDFPSAQAAMRTFVANISTYAKTRRPGFLIVPQNGEELTRNAAYLNAIDAIAREELVFGLEGGEHENPPDEITYAMDILTKVARTGRPVFVVEYVGDAEHKLTASRLLSARRFVATFAERELNTPPTLPPDTTPVFVPPPEVQRQPARSALPPP
jgi:cysteinyl-tRNA synthetase, unknown class